MTIENKKLDLDLAASEAGGYVEQLTEEESNELSRYDIRAVCELVTKLDRPLTAEELNQFRT